MEDAEKFGNVGELPTRVFFNLPCTHTRHTAEKGQSLSPSGLHQHQGEPQAVRSLKRIMVVFQLCYFLSWRVQPTYLSFPLTTSLQTDIVKGSKLSCLLSPEREGWIEVGISG